MNQTSGAELRHLFSSHFPHLTLQKHSNLVLLWLKKKSKLLFIEKKPAQEVMYCSEVMYVY